MRPIAALGAGALRFVSACGRLGYFGWAVVRSSVRYGVRRERVLAEMHKIGLDSLAVLATMSIFVGTNLAVQGYAAFSLLGAQNLLGMFVALAGGREVCPLLAGTMVAAKAGTEMTALLAVMRTKEQIDALEVMAIDPYAELIAPGFVAAVLVMPALSLIALFLSLVSATVVAIYQLGVDESAFYEFLYGYLSPYDFVVVCVKSMVFGFLIVLVSGFFGFHSARGPQGVGQATNRAVVAMCILCICANYLLSAVFYG